MTISSRELRQKFLDFHASKGHAIIPSAPLVPKEDPTVLFNTAGMQPIVPYLMGQVHPEGNMLANSQKCLRTDDIEEVGDNRHATFFEMLGNWSMGAYFKKEIIEWSMEFLTSPKWLGLDPNRIFVTVYKGNGNDVGADEEAIGYWQQEYKKLGFEPEIGEEYDFKNPENNQDGAKYVYRIRKMKGKDNWWGLPYRGPCGPCSEMYYLLPGNPVDFETSLFPKMTLKEIEDFVENQIVEIGNNVFMQYIGEKDANKEPINLEPMEKKNIDTGLGFERFLTVINGYESIYETDCLKPISDVADKWSGSRKE
jgi:alanyl-tRNA synthetase